MEGTMIVPFTRVANRKGPFPCLSWQVVPNHRYDKIEHARCLNKLCRLFCITSLVTKHNYFFQENKLFSQSLLLPI